MQYNQKLLIFASKSLAMAQNTYIHQEITATTPPKKKKLVFKPLKDRRFQIAWGFFLLFWALYLLFAFVSYLFTAQADQSLVEAYNETGIREAGEEVENWLGIYGAIFSYYFIYRWFGLGAFFLIPLLANWGFQWIFKMSILPTKKILALLFFVALWLSTLLGYLAIFLPQNSFVHSIAGVTGFAIAELLSNLIGIGTVFLLIVVFLVFVVYFFNLTTLKKANNNADLPQSSKKKEKNEEKIIRKPIPKEEQEEFDDVPLQENLQNKFSENEETDDELEKLGIVLINKATGEIIKENKKVSKNTPIQENNIKTESKLQGSLIENRQENIQDVLEIAQNERKQVWDAPHLELEREQKNEYPEKQLVMESKKRRNDDEIILEIQPNTPINTISHLQETDFEEKSFDEEEYDEDTIPEPENNNEQEADWNIEKLGTYDPRQDLSRYQFPTLQLLNEIHSRFEVSKEELEANKNRIVTTLANYGIGITSIKATIGPTVTLYEIVPDAGVRISKIKNLEDDIALSLSALGIRIIAPIPGKGTIGIEVPNQKREVVGMRNLLASEKFQNSTMDLPIVFGKTVTNEIFMVDLTKMPHLLIAGATGQGKSVGLNVILTSLLYKKHPAELKLVLIDPKKVELTLFNRVERHFLAKLPNEEEAIITDTSKVINTLNSLCIEMDNRYSLLKEASCRNIKEYNQKFKERKLNPKKGHRFLPYIVLIIDELADLMITAGKEVEQPIARLAQLARAIGIHLVVATQRPSVNVITGVIKANFPARLSFRVTSKIDSRTILDAGGAEQLIGMGDMLYSTGSDLVRVQCAFIDTPEVENICEFIGSQQGYASAYLLPEYVGEAGEGNQEDFDFDDRDELFEEAARIVVMHQQGSTSLLQRRLKLGYNRAGRIIDQLEKAGIVGAFEGSKAREVLIPDEVSLEKHLKSLK
ncbi:DNA translocase FtsK [Raineya orbicola]|uniref:DNA segregation ATPase FtsK/SpoIIIE n=1 Tax=Raineya orbicola TaxID=2016530 RepID=A0A2N3IJW8_9BACT|nr:DNA translocase FtsK [Raineya orbicola]PKQ70571.1 DNA segregation ATPase FtsK/SpoIIIE [Raineya orbicola]